MYHHQHDANAGVEQQYHFSAGSSNYGYGPYNGGMAETTIPGFQNSPLHLSPRPVMHRTLSHARHTSMESQRAMRPPTSSPRIREATPVRNAQARFIPTDRSLPAKEVTADNLTDAYASFILYCNPNFSLDVDTATLRTKFESPPQSDNKEFETYRLFELVGRLESKDIKTWGQLALELGVEAPDTSRGQSTQKVQQYTVRLKRWMRAMHVDAFFDYLHDKSHAYFEEIPPPNDPYPADGRGGVLAEEDLAVRALDPSFRPKRGRRRNSDPEQSEDAETGSASKQRRLMDDATHGAPGSAHPINMMSFDTTRDDIHDPWAVASAVTPQTFAPWAQRTGVPQTAIATTAPSHLRWQLHDSSQNPSTPHPMTAHPTSMAAHIQAAFDSEPKSAITPSARKRRKHGPAVSSAWPISNAPGAKPRGRPPQGRDTQDGPFSTFPADPSTEKQSSMSFSTPLASVEPQVANNEQSTMQHPPAPMARQSDGLGRPGRLSLQVPQHNGGPVRLATPPAPPTVLVNGEMNERKKLPAMRTSESQARQQPAVTAPNRPQSLQPVDREIPGFAFEALKRVLASDLLRAELIGRRYRLNGDEAKRLADAVLDRFNVPREDTDNSRDDIARLTAASWLGVGEQLNVPLGPATGRSKRVTVTRFRADAEGYEEIVSGYEDSNEDIREVFDLTWTVTMGGCNGNFELKGLSLGNSSSREPDVHDKLLAAFAETAKQIGGAEANVALRTTELSNSERYVELQDTGADDERIDWKSKYRALEFGTKMAKGEFDRFKQRVIEKLLDALI